MARGKIGKLATRPSFEALEPRLLLSSVSGHVAVDTLWNDTSEPYVLNEDLYVDAEATLTIASGVRVETPNSDYDIFVDGTVVASAAAFSGDSTEIRVRAGGQADLTNNAMSGQMYYESGSTGTLHNCDGSWDLSVAGDAVMVNQAAIDTVSLAGSATVADSTIGSMSVSAMSPTIVGSTIGYITFSGGAPTIMGNTLTDDVPFRITDPDVDISGIVGNSYQSADPWIHVQGTVDGSQEFSVIDGFLGRYILSGGLTVGVGATLTLSPGVTLATSIHPSLLYGINVCVAGRLEASGAAIELASMPYWTGWETVAIRSSLDIVNGGELLLSGGTVDGGGRIKVQNGGQADLLGVNFPSMGTEVTYDDGSSGTVANCSGGCYLSITGNAVMVLNNAMSRVSLSGGKPTISGNTFTDDMPIRITDLDDVDVGGITGNTYSSSNPWVGIHGVVDASRELGFIDGVLGDYGVYYPFPSAPPPYWPNHLTVGAAATLTLLPGVALRASYYRGIQVDGILEGTDATLVLSGGYYENDLNALYVRDGGELTLSGGTVRGGGRIEVEEGSQANLASVTFSDDGGSPEVRYTSGSTGTVDDCGGNWSLIIASDVVSVVNQLSVSSFDLSAEIILPSGINVGIFTLSVPVAVNAATIGSLLLSASATVTNSAIGSVDVSSLLPVLTGNTISHVTISGGAPSITGNIIDYVTISDGTGTITGNTVGYVTISGGTVTITGNTLMDDMPLRIADLDMDISGFVNNSYAAAHPWVGIGGTLDNSREIGFVDGILGRYRLRQDLTVASGATLTLASGVEVQSDSYYLDIFIHGRLEGQWSTIGLLDSGGYGDVSTVYVRDGGELDLTEGTVVGPGRIEVEGGGRVNLAGVVSADNGGVPHVQYDDGSSGTVEFCTLEHLSVHSGAGVTIVNNDFSSCSVSPTGDSSTTVDMTNNWWGTTDPDEIEAKIFHHADWFFLPWVDYTPWLLKSPIWNLSHSPSGPVAGPVDSVRFHFNHSMDTESFDLADDVGVFTGPEGALSTTGYYWPDSQTLELTFALQSGTGTYEIVIGPHILNADGDPMNLDLDDLPGEMPDDQYVATFTITPPRILGHTPSGAMSGPVESVRLSFDHPMDQGSFSLVEDIVDFTGPQGPVTLTGYSWIDPQTLEVTFQANAAGEYQLVIGPQILDAAGNALDQDGDLAVGEVPDDEYVATFTITPPRILGHTPSGAMSGPVESVRLSFDHPMDQGSFSLVEDIVDFTGPQGPVTLTGYSWIDPQTLEVTFQANAAGEYQLVIGPQILDAAGNALDQDGDLAVGEVPDDEYVATFTITPPRILGHTPSGVTSGPVESVRLSFDHPMDQGSFSLVEDIVDFTGPQGPVTLTGYSWIDPQTLEVTFQANAAGEYQLVIGPQILDAAGNALDQDGDLAVGEVPDDEYVATFTITPPQIVGHTPSGVTSGPVESVRLSFDHPMDQGSFSLVEDIVDFTGPQGSVTLVGYSWVDPKTLEVTFDPQTAAGVYQLVVGPDILDLAGHKLDQDGDWNPGETPDDQYAAWFALGYSGTLLQDTTWTAANGVLVADSVTVPNGVTLTIEAGTVVKFVENSSGITVHGTLEINGTADEPVILTSVRDDTIGGDTNADGDATNPAAGDWAGIHMMGGVARVENTVIRFADIGVLAYLHSENTRVEVANSEISNGNIGTYFGMPFSEIVVENTLISNNQHSGIQFLASNQGTYRNVTIVNNGFDPGHVLAWVEVSTRDAGGVRIQGSTLILENSIVAFNANGLNHWWGDIPEITIRNSDFYNPIGEEIIWDGDPGMPQLDQNGNIIADPVFVDVDNGNYELAEGSPAIDAGCGVGAPGTDIFGRSRYDDPGIANFGVGHPSYVDIGAFERQTPSLAHDLAVAAVSDPDPVNVEPGDTFSVTWTVENSGDCDLMGDWYDVVYLSNDSYLNTAEDRLLEVRVHYGGLEVGQKYTETWTGCVPFDVAGPQRVLVYTNRGGSGGFRESFLINNMRTSQEPLAVKVPLLTVDAYQTGHVEEGRWAFYHFESDPGRTVKFVLDSEVSSGSVHLYVRRGVPPTVSAYDASATAFNQPDQELRLLDPADAVYYLGVCGQSLGPGGTDFTLSAELTDLDIRQITQDHVGSAGRATIRIEGDNFDRNAQAQLLAPDGTTIIEGEEWFQDAATLFVTFDLAVAGAVPGLYDVVITNPGPESVTAYDLLTIEASGAAEFETNLVVPGLARPGRNIKVHVEYRNTGSIDLPSPLLSIESDEGAAWLLPDNIPENDWIEASTVSFLALSPDGPAAILRPGQSETLTITARTPFAPGDMSFTLYSFGTPDSAGVGEAIDWAGLGDDIRPPDTPSDAWGPLFERLKAQTGDTWGEYLSMLRENADHLAELDQRVYNASELFAFEFVQAATMGAPAYLEAAQDAFCPAPGLPLSFERYFLPGPSYRARQGALGRGWTHSYEITLQQRSDGSVVVNGPSGFDRFFESDDNGGYVVSPGDNAALTALPDGEFLLTELNGLETRFRSDGLFASINDTNGNQTVAAYDADGRLVSAIHSSGDRFRFEYDDTTGRLIKMTDHAGRETTYIYDVSGGYLLSVVRPDGEVTSYDYVIGEGLLTDHNLVSITGPDGMLISFSYDAFGRLEEHHVATNEESVEYSYSSAGKTFITDALDNTITTWLDSRGRTARVEDPLGNRADMAYDATSNLVSVVGPTGLSSHFEYDGFGGLTSSQDPMGYVTAFGYGGGYHDLAWVRDARGNTTSYEYDETGNLNSITYPDETFETFQYDGAGNLIAWTNRRGDTITYAYNDRGQLTSKAYSDGTTFTYVYDAAGRLTAATDTRGTTSFQYDPDNDWLTRINYPAGQYFIIEYDASGRRSKRTDQDGNILNYIYDFAGRLDRMTDSTDALIVDYDYDFAGRLELKTLGNHVHTDYTYDVAGRLTNLVNYAPDDSVLSHFDYTYDATGRRTSMGTLYGAWTYEYDNNGQLIHAVLDSTSPDIDDQDLAYVYDPVGNRIRTVTNGVTTEYTTNEMNQYTQVGDATYAYDDGNLISKTQGGVTTTYAYNYENRLIQVAMPTDTWLYTYDALENRIAASHNGVVTDYVIDPAGLGNVAAECDSSGNLIARYDHGYGLLSQTDAAADSAWYTFDAIGSTSQLTDATGTVLNDYAYTPFGISLERSEIVSNPFQYVGEYGVMHETNGLEFMRARFYKPELGRFGSEDPMGLAGQGNTYTYVDNGPVGLIDPLGLFGWRDAVSRVGRGLHAVGTSVSRGKVIAYVGMGVGGALILFPEPGTTAAGVAILGSSIKAAKVLTALDVGPPGGPNAFQELGLQMQDWAEAEEKRQQAIERHRSQEADRHRQAEEIKKNLQDKPIKPQTPDARYGPNNTRLRASATPEDKFGPAGYDAPDTLEGSEVRYVPAGQTFEYRIDFWNKPDAVVPTQDAIIEDTLDPAVFDLSTFEFTRFGFLKWDVPLAGGQAIDMRVDCRPDMNIAVDVTASLDPETGIIRWWFHCIDPLTGDYPEDPMAGFLPPFDPETEYELGWVEFTVKPKDGLPSGTQIANQAFVEFDLLGDLYDHPAPKEGPWINIIDADLPVSQVEPLPAITTTADFLVEWTGEDDAGGSGIASYDIYVSTNGGEYTLWLDDTTESEAMFSGEYGKTFAFYSAARDNVGHAEDTPLAPPDTQTYINTPPAPDGGPDGAIDEGQAFAASGNFTDPDPYDAGLWTATVDYGDGSGEQLLTLDGMDFDLSHFYADNGTYGLVVTVTDSQGVPGSDMIIVTVNNVAPTVDAGPDQTADEDTEVHFVGSFDDPGTLDTHDYLWDFGDGHTANSLNASHTYVDPGIYTAMLTVTDDDGGAGSDTVEITVLDTTPPTVAQVQMHGGLTQRSKIGTIDIVFSEGVTVGQDDLQLRNDTTGEDITLPLDIFDYDGTATWDLSGVELADGYYTATLSAAGIQDAAGNAMAEDHIWQFHVLKGDATGDAKVNIFDLLKVRQNYLKPAGPDRDDNADVTGDGNVNIFDLLMVRQNYLQELSPPEGAGSMSMALSSGAQAGSDVGGVFISDVGQGDANAASLSLADESQTRSTKSNGLRFIDSNTVWNDFVRAIRSENNTDALSTERSHENARIAIPHVLVDGLAADPSLEMAVCVAPDDSFSTVGTLARAAESRDVNPRESVLEDGLLDVLALPELEAPVLVRL